MDDDEDDVYDWISYLWYYAAILRHFILICKSVFPSHSPVIGWPGYLEFPGVYQLIHNRNEYQGKDGCKWQTENDRPRKGTKKLTRIPPDVNLRTQISQKSTEIDVETDGQREHT